MQHTVVAVRDYLVALLAIAETEGLRHQCRRVGGNGVEIGVSQLTIAVGVDGEDLVEVL